MTEEITYGSDNVFADLLLPDPEARQIKAELAMQIGSCIRERGLNQSAAGKLLGLDQPRVSALLRGKLAGFSIERLIRCLDNLNKHVSVIVEDRDRRAEESHAA